MVNLIGSYGVFFVDLVNGIVVVVGVVLIIKKLFKYFKKWCFDYN